MTSMSYPLVSVIVPNYNHEKYLEQRLETIFNQTYPNFEVIILDDCSTDNSRSILSKYAVNAKVSHCIFNEINSGNTFIQWNKGINLAKGEYIWIAETDDFCSDNFVEKVIQPLLQDQDVVLSYCQSNKVSENGDVIGNWKAQTDSLNENQFEKDFILDGNIFIEHYLIYKNVIPNASAVLIKKEQLKIDDKLIISRQFKYCGDWIVYFSQIINAKIGFIATSHNSFRTHQNSVIAKALRHEERNLIIDIDLEMRKLLLSILKKNKPVNSTRIISNNKKAVKSLKYEKAFFLFHNHQKWKGIFLLITIMGEFYSRYPFRKTLALKLTRKSV
jgi:glycosyltransferase involved in cell wall biosynthesis